MASVDTLSVFGDELTAFARSCVIDGSSRNHATATARTIVCNQQQADRTTGGSFENTNIFMSSTAPHLARPEGLPEFADLASKAGSPLPANSFRELLEQPAEKY